MRPKLNIFNSSFQEAHQFIFTEAPIDIVAELALEWGTPLWWPKTCPLEFIASDNIPLRENKFYTLQIQGVYPLRCRAQVTKHIPDRCVELTFTTGIFEGQEKITLEERSNGTRIDHEIRYRIRGILNQILWHGLYARQYERWINSILLTIKEFSEKIYAERQETV